MGEDLSFIQDCIPHRAPFLWLDRIVDLQDEKILAQKEIKADLDVLQGHYPDYPIMPGVLLCEAVFQAGAVLVGRRLTEQNSAVPVLTRIQGAKFKREVKPGDTIDIEVTLIERVGPAWFLKGNVRVDGKLAVRVEFAISVSSR